MSATGPEPTEAGRTPSYETARETHLQVVLTHDARRLYWTLSGPLTSAISVMDDKWYDPDVPLESYCVQAELSLSWHSIAQSALTEPKISSVTVSVEQLNDWEDEWWELRRDNDDLVPVGTDFDEEDDGPQSALRSCYEDMPRDEKATLVVKATEAFVTVHDYVSVVHPWLMSLREKILQASGDLLDNIPLPPDTRLMVQAFPSPDCITTVEEEEWKRSLSKKEHEKAVQRIEAYKRKMAVEDHEAHMQDQGW